MNDSLLVFGWFFIIGIVGGFVFWLLLTLMGWQSLLTLIAAALLFATLAAIIDHITGRRQA